MKIEIETKYNIGDVLYYADPYWNIIKVKVEQIEVIVQEDTKYVRYKFSNGNNVCEKYLGSYFDTPEEAGNYFAQVAIKNMTEK